MSGDSPESTTHESIEDTSQSSKDLPRKRTKVSRACDACRRKKIRCDAEYSTTLSQVTKSCTNCSKTGEHCLFSRVPLKRGPSKGYTREVGDPIDSAKEGQYSERADEDGFRSRSQSMDGVGMRFYSKASKREHQGVSSLIPPSQVPPCQLPNSSPSSQAPQSKLSSQSPSQLPSSLPPQLPSSLPSQLSSSLPPQLPQTQTKPFPHRPKFASTSHITQHIILPPIMQPSSQKIKLSLPIPKYANSVSPHSGVGMPNLPNGIGGENEHRIQGPLWKVPYEMPTLSAPRSMCSPSPSNGVHSRKSSVDSINSVSTSGSISRPPSLRPPLSLNYDSDGSDTASLRTGSRHNSISSLSSLNGRVMHHLSIGSNESVPIYPQQGSELTSTPNSGHSGPPLMIQQHSPHTDTRGISQRGSLSMTKSESISPFNGISSTSLLESDLKTYYAYIHAGFPLLPFDESLIPHIIADLEATPGIQASVVTFFIISLSNLIRYQIVSNEDIRGSLLHFNRTYPFTSPPRNEVLYLTFAALLLINYTILLRGDSCSSAIAAANGLFTDFKVLQTHKSLACEELMRLGRDDIQLYLPRLYLCLQIIDSCHALSWGNQSQIKRPSTFSLANTPRIFSENNLGEGFNETTEIGKLFEILEAMKNEEVFDNKPRRKRSRTIVLSTDHTDRENIASRLIRLQKDKFELFDFAIEVCDFFESHVDFEDEYMKDHIHDYQLKTSRLAKKLSQSILGFVNYISSTRYQQKPMSSESPKQINPFLNIIFGQCLGLIKTSKLFVECLIENSNDNETISRCTKIINDLSISTNLLIGDINQSCSRIENSGRTERVKHTGFPEQLIQNEHVLQGPGVLALKLFSRKINAYDWTFKNKYNRSSTNESEGMRAWKDSFVETTNYFVLGEDINGWL